MFYVKEGIGESAEINIEITDENVFSRCPKCGCETKVQLDEIFREEGADLFNTDVFCEACSRKICRERICHGNK